MSRERTESADNDWRHLLRVGLPLGAVLGILIMGAYLQTDDPRPVPAPSSVTVKPDAASVPPRVAGPTESDPAGPTRREVERAVVEPPAVRAGQGELRIAEALALRASNDAARLAQAGDGWTLQLGVYCDMQHVSSQVERFGHHSSFHVLPILLDGQACFRLCWGSYPGPDAAKQAADLPSALRASGAFPQESSTVLR